MIKVEETIRNGETIQNSIRKEINYIASFIDYQKTLKNYISNVFDIISSNTNFKKEYSNEIKNYYQKISEAKLNLTCNMITLQNLFKELRKLKCSKGVKLSNQILNYNNSFLTYFKDIKQKTKSSKRLADNLFNYINNNKIKTKKLKIFEAPEFDIDTIKDNNTLKISEKTKKVYLPFSVSELNKIIENNPQKYSCKKDLINKKYVIPLSYYKNSTYARFRESYKLVREKEKGSISEALNLAFESLFNYNLDPAIISACRNIDELDIYLDCLDENELDDFYCFNILYEEFPIKTKTVK